MRLGALVVGLGNMGRHHVRNYAGLAGVELKGVIDSDLSLALDMASQYGCPAFDDVSSVTGGDIDIASVCVPTGLHADVAVPLLEAGISVLIEKPVAATESDVLRIRAAAEKSGARVAVGHIERYNGAVVALKRLVQSGQLGEVLQIIARREGPDPGRITDTNVIMDIGTHDIDLLCHLLGRCPSAVWTAGGRFRRKQVEDYAGLLLAFPGDNGHLTTGYIQVNWTSRSKVRRVEVTGAEGRASADLISQTLSASFSASPTAVRNYDEYIRSFTPGVAVEVPVTRGEPLRREMEQFVNWCSGHEADVVSLDEGLRAVLVATRATELIRQDTRDNDCDTCGGGRECAGCMLHSPIG